MNFSKTRRNGQNRFSPKRIFGIVFIIASLFSLYFVPWVVLKLRLTPLPNHIQKQVDQSISFGFEGIIVYVDQNGQPPAFYTAGYHERDNKISARPDALFKIASIGKLYHAVAITKLVRAHKLSLDKTLADYFPELANKIQYADQITLRSMVQHRSGIPNFTDAPDFWMNPPDNNKDLLELILNQPAKFKPNEKYHYSNTNYLLLAELIEKTVGYSTSQYIHEQILDPLDLQHTFYSLDEVDLEQVMSGYYVGIDEDFKTDGFRTMVATAQDVGTFIRALNDGSVFNNGEKEIYATLYKYEHTGLIPGYQSIAKYHADIDAVVIQFTNTTDFQGYHWDLSTSIYRRILKILKRQTK